MYILQAEAGSYRFDPIIATVNGDLSEQNFVASP
jgi:hypothetical protein